MAPPLQSLVRYDNATLISTTKDKGKLPKDKAGKKVWAPSLSTISRSSRPLTIWALDLLVRFIC